MFPQKESIFQFDRIEDGIDFSIEYARRSNMEILIAGGLFLSIEAYHFIKGLTPPLNRLSDARRSE